MKRKSLVIILILLSTPLFSAQLTLSGVPLYYWYYGCAPTSGGMLIGYWDARGYNLVDGDISTYNAAAKNAIATVDHVNDYWGVDGPGSHADNSIADFMDTSVDPASDGGTYDISYNGNSGIAQGLTDFAAWDNPDTVGVNESYAFTAVTERTTARPDLNPTGNFGFTDVINEIDQGKPLIINALLPIGGHSFVVYGYQDNPGDTNDWVAVYDTWADGTTASVGAKTESGHEWWLWDIVNTGGVDNYYFVSATTFSAPGAPEPGSMILFSLGTLMMWRKRRKND